MDGYHTKSVTLSREELYKQVWETPMHTLAKQYGVTGNGLAKICRRLGVPYPPRGHWAKKAASKPIVQYRLLKAGPQTPAQVTIRPTLPQLKSAECVPADIAAELPEIPALRVPRRLTNPHPVIAKWLTDHERERIRARYDRSSSAYRPPVFTELEKRQHRLLDALFKALEELGVKVQPMDWRKYYFEVDGERIDVQLREKQKQVKRPLTADEKRWGYYGKEDMRQVLEPTGRLVFKITSWLGQGVKSEWIDHPAQTLEDQLREIVSGVLIAGAVKKKMQLEREEERRREEKRQYRKKPAAAMAAKRKEPLAPAKRARV
jgi:hypothetical protein